MGDRARTEIGPRHFGRSVLVPIGLLICVALGLSVLMVGYSAHLQDKLTREASIEAVNDFVAAKARQVAGVAKDYGWWDDSVRHMYVERDFDWADRNLGGYINGTFGYQVSIVLDSEGRTVYASIDGIRRQMSLEDITSTDLRAMMQAARATPLELPYAISGLLDMHGQVLVASAVAITPELDSPFEIDPASRSVLLIGKRLDGPFLGELPSIVRVENLRVEPEGAPTTMPATLPLVAVDGRTLGHLAWEPDRPGSATLAKAAPMLAAALTVIAIGAGVVLLVARRTSEALLTSEARFRDVADATSDWIWETDPDLRVTYLSAPFTEATGMPATALLDRRLPEVLQHLPGHAATPLHGAAPMQAFRDVRCHYTDEQGTSRTLKMSGVPIRDRRGRHVGYRGTATDITRELEAQSRAQFLAVHDALTGLPNRLLFAERLEAVLERARAGAQAGLLCVDLDRFKQVNDDLGHDAGDQLLREVARRLVSLAQDGDTVARLGGDEFVMLRATVEDAADLVQVAGRLLQSFEAPFAVHGQELVVAASIGVAFLPRDGSTTEHALRSADLALLSAKQSGRNAFALFEPGMDAHMQRRVAVENDLRGALRASEFRLAYQPRINLPSNRVVGVEALVRWQHPREGLLLPGQFIGVAEESGLIKPLGDWILKTACAQAREWPELTLAVNISPVQFKSRNFLSGVREALAETGFDPQRLELEVTEGVLLENTEQSLATLRELRELGVRLSLDDFGTGFASLNYLLLFEFDKIKIDRSFILRLMDGRGADAIVRSVLGLGRSLGVDVCAEGVETLDQLEFLRREGCAEVQGFLFSAPVPADEVALITDCARWTSTLWSYQRSSRAAWA